MESDSISAVIATYNRAPELTACLERLGRQTRVPDEIIVVDDASGPDTRRCIAERFPRCKYIRFHRNHGYIAARNLGISTASGDYILSLDDDSWFVEDDALARALNRMRSLPDAGCLAFNIAGRDGGRSFALDAPPRDVGTFVGCGHLLRAEALQATGLYAEEMRSMGEEADLSIRLYHRGYRVVACPDIAVFHAFSPSNRSWARIRYSMERSSLMRELLRCPAPILPYYFLRTWAGQALYNLRTGYYLHDLRILLALPRMAGTACKARKPVSLATYRRWRGLSGELT